MSVFLWENMGRTAEVSYTRIMRVRAALDRVQQELAEPLPGQHDLAIKELISQARARLEMAARLAKAAEESH